jgi:putative two-component system hydrogenase maturation factor HypX/HoxX
VPAASGRIDWSSDDSAEVLRKIAAPTATPACRRMLFGQPCRLFDDAHPASAATLARAPAGSPGEVVAARPGAAARTVDGAVWIGHVRRGEGGARLSSSPPRAAFAAGCAGLPELAMVPLLRDAGDEWDELRYAEFGPPARAWAGWLRLPQRRDVRRASAPPARRAALAHARHAGAGAGRRQPTSSATASTCTTSRPPQRAGDSAADASMAQHQRHRRRGAGAAHDDRPPHRGRAARQRRRRRLLPGAGRRPRSGRTTGVVLNPHYKNMGNLYGSEYWTYRCRAASASAPAAR